MPDAGNQSSVWARLRRRAGLTQEQLAEESGLAVRSIRSLERGQTEKPRMTSLRLLAGPLGMSEADLAFALGVASRSASPDAVSSSEGVPHRLPVTMGDLTGRDVILTQVADILSQAEEQCPPGSAMVVNLSGRPGVGKSALAIAAGHHLRPYFPDGQLFADLGGARRRPRSSYAVLGDLLSSLGVEASAVPTELSERRAVFERRTAQRRVLLVLDDAVDEGHIEPLIPALPAVVIATSRRPLAALAGVRILDVDSLSLVDSCGLLTRMVGDERASAEPEELAAIASACAGLPLALRIAGARLAVRPGIALRVLATALANEHRRLDELHFGDLDVRAPLALTLAALSAADQRAFAVLGRLEFGPFEPEVAEAALALSPHRTAETLERLLDARLLDIVASPHDRVACYRFHDLVRLYAVQTHLPDSVWRDALSRVAGRLLAMASAADQALPSFSDVVSTGSTTRLPATGDTMERIVTDPDGWLSAHEVGLEATVHQLADEGLAEGAWELAEHLRTYAMLRSRPELWRATHAMALAACRSQGNRLGEASMLFGLGRWRHSEHVMRDAEPVEFIAAVRMFNELGDQAAESCGRSALAQWYAWAGQVELAVDLASQALQMARSSGSPRALDEALSVLGRAYMYSARWPQARAVFQEALVLSQSLGNSRDAAFCRRQLGAVLRAEGDNPGARDLLEQALSAVREVGDSRGEATLLIDLGTLAIEVGQTHEALVHLGDALAASEKANAPGFRARALMAVAEAYDAIGDTAEAVRALVDAEATWRDVGDARRIDETASRRRALEAVSSR